jgi:GNAT superfamily N-acetyltransferase
VDRGRPHSASRSCSCRAGLGDDLTPEVTIAIEDTEEIVAFVVVETRGVAEWWLDHMVVRPRSQGGGLGTAVVRWILGSAEGAQADVTLSVVDGNPARELYTRLGFETERIEPPRNFMRWSAQRA